MIKVLVVGGHGLIGEALAKETLKKSDCKFFFVTRKELEIGHHNQFSFEGYDTIIDLVPPPFPRQFSDLSQEQYHSQFTIPHCGFISLALRYPIKKYIYLSSGGAIYGQSENQVPFLETDNLNPISFYGESKKMVEEHLLKESSGKNVSCCILRPSNVYNSNPLSSKQSGIIGVYLTHFKNKTPIEVFGSRSIAKDFIASEDVAKAIILSLNSDIQGVFNIGSGKTTTIADIIKAFETSFGHKAEVIEKESIANDIKWFNLNISKAKRNLKFESTINLIDWILTSTKKRS